MLNYHRSCYRNSQAVVDDVVKCYRKNLKRSDFVQTTKELYIPVPNGVANQNPVYRNYFNTFFIHEWKDRTDEEANRAIIEFRKFSRETDDDCHLKLPSKPGGDYWIPDQFSPWKWGCVFNPVPRMPQEEVLFRKYYSPRRRNLLTRLKNRNFYSYINRLSYHPPDYKIVIN